MAPNSTSSNTFSYYTRNMTIIWPPRQYLLVKSILCWISKSTHIPFQLMYERRSWIDLNYIQSRFLTCTLHNPRWILPYILPKYIYFLYEMINYRLKCKFYFFFFFYFEVRSGERHARLWNWKYWVWQISLLAVSKYKILLLPYFSKTISSTYFCLQRKSFSQ